MTIVSVTERRKLSPLCRRGRESPGDGVNPSSRSPGHIIHFPSPTFSPTTHNPHPPSTPRNPPSPLFPPFPSHRHPLLPVTSRRNRVTCTDLIPSRHGEITRLSLFFHPLMLVPGLIVHSRFLCPGNGQRYEEQLTFLNLGPGRAEHMIRILTVLTEMFPGRQTAMLPSSSIQSTSWLVVTSPRQSICRDINHTAATETMYQGNILPQPSQVLWGERAISDDPKSPNHTPFH